VGDIVGACVVGTSVVVGKMVGETLGACEGAEVGRIEGKKLGDKVLNVQHW